MGKIDLSIFIRLEIQGFIEDTSTISLAEEAGFFTSLNESALHPYQTLPLLNTNSMKVERF